MDDPGSAVHQVAAKFLDGGVVKLGQGFPTGEVDDRKLGGIVAELGEVGADKAIALAEVGVGEIDPLFDVDDGGFPIDAGAFQRGGGEGDVADQSGR